MVYTIGIKDSLKKMGKMVLAEGRSMNYKIVDYKKCINHFIASVKNAHDEAPHKRDLEILMKQGMCLKK